MRASGSTVRIDQVKAEPGQVEVYFHARPNLVETFREIDPELNYSGTARPCSMRPINFPKRSYATAWGRR
jgi:hypothetical protein